MTVLTYTHKDCQNIMHVQWSLSLWSLSTKVTLPNMGKKIFATATVIAFTISRSLKATSNVAAGSWQIEWPY